MGLFQRRKNGVDAAGDAANATNTTPISDELNEQAQEVMKDNLELMKDVVMRIRNEPDFAKGIYKDCPRLQHLLDQYPDLRPIFEDPKLVRINFEQVYRDAGGVLPEDEKKKKSWLVRLVNSPCFKVLKVFLFLKKLIGCIAGGGFAFLSGCLMGCCFEDALEEMEDGDFEDIDGDMDPTKEALNKAADHMEDPEVQEQMQALLEDPDNLQEAIENDEELRALRDSNPLCEELMSDPETMRVLTDPDNLRALGEAPQLIEADFVDPDGFMAPDIETGGFDGLGDGGYDAFDGGDGMDFGDADADFDLDAEVDDGFDGAEGDIEADGEGEFEAEEEDDEDGWWDDAELEEQSVDGADADGANNTANKGGKGQAKSQSKGQQQAQQAGADGKSGRFGGIMATIGVAATEVLAAQIVGNIFDMPGGDMGGGMGGMDGMGGTDALDDAGVTDIADDAGDVIDDDLADAADAAEDTMDEVDEKAEERENEKAERDADMNDDGKKKGGAAAGGAAAGGAVAGGAMASGSGERGEKDSKNGEDKFEDEEEEEKPKKSRFGMIGNFAAAISTAAKEHVATAILGDDWGEQLVERMEEDKDEDKEDEENEDEEGKQKEEKPKKRGLFGRGKK